MRILVVVHGFPPAARGGAEIYAHAHARVLKEIFGDEIFVLTREQDPGRAEYTIRTEAHDGLQIAWVNNTFRNTRSFEDSYRNEAIGAIATRLIDDFRPDVAHVHHLTCLSTTIVGALAERGVPCFFTLHDYWLICHRGQLLDVHYRVCEGPEPDGCDVCLGSGGGVGTLGFIGAATARALERRLPAAPARQLRRVVSRLAPIAADAREAGEDARRRLAHMRHVCDDVTHFFAPSRCICERFVQFGVPRERITVAGYGYDHGAYVVEKIFFTLSGAFTYLYLFLTVNGSFDIKFNFVHSNPWATAVLLIGGAVVIYLVLRAIWPKVVKWWDDAKEGGRRPRCDRARPGSARARID